MYIQMSTTKCRPAFIAEPAPLLYIRGEPPNTDDGMLSVFADPAEAARAVPVHAVLAKELDKFLSARTPQEARMKLLRPPIKPKRSPLLSLKLNNPKYASWRVFVDNPSAVADVM